MNLSDCKYLYIYAKFKKNLQITYDMQESIKYSKYSSLFLWY